jgi:adenylate cyclase
MPNVHCLPDDQDVDCPEGSATLEPLVAAGIPIAHVCGGHARCSTCRVRVVEGLENVEPRSPAEQELADKLQFDDSTRLACQLRVRADATLRRLVIDRDDMVITSRIGHEHEHATAGREVEATVLFADVAGFTTLSEKLPAYDIIHLLDRYFRAVGEPIEEAGGYVDNYMGDGLMALFGACGEEDHAYAAIRAALGMHAATAKVAEYVREVYGEDFSIRVGIHTGSLVVGTIGACHKRRETAIGDTVNVASRIEGAGKSAGANLLVSCETLRRVEGRVSIGKDIEIPLKGKSGTFRLHEVTGLAGD